MKNCRRNLTDSRLARSLFASLIFLVGYLLTGCATSPRPAEPDNDPFSRANRASYKINNGIDRYFFDPVTDAYRWVTPDYFERRITNFFNNFSDLNTIPNQFLQGKFGEGWSDVQRFTINTTIGLVGFYDVAGKWGYEQHDEDFGQTLGYHGIPAGPYLVIPLFGPTTVRDLAGTLTTTFISRILFLPVDSLLATSLRVLDTVDERARVDQKLEKVRETAVDEYLYLREAFIQRRNFLLYDGNPPMEDLDLLSPEDDDFDMDDDFLMEDDFLLEDGSEDDWRDGLEDELLMEGDEEPQTESDADPNAPGEAEVEIDPAP